MTRGVFLVCAALSALPFLASHRMPMVDLPEHAAQIALWKAYHDPCYGFDRIYDLQLATPYIGGYALARLFATILTVNDALKLCCYLGVVGLALAFRFLLRRTTLDPNLALLAFPLAFNFSFYWGFFNFVVALPLAVVYLGLLFDDGKQRQRALWLLLLLVTHALLTAACVAITIVVAIARRQPRMLLPTIPPLLALIAWAIHMRNVSHQVHVTFLWWLGTYRLAELPSHLLNRQWDPAALLFVAGAIVVVWLAGARPSREPLRWLLAAIFGLTYLVGPRLLFGTAMVYERFAVLFALFLLFAFDAGRARVPGAAIATLLVLLVAAWMLLLAVRFRRFGDDAQRFDRLVDRMRSNARMVLLNVDRSPFIHFGGYYQERKGGMVAWSFAHSFPVVVHYKPGAELPLEMDEVFDAARVDWPNLMNFDYIVIRSPFAQRALLARAPRPLALVAREGDWWLYATNRAAGAGRIAPCP